MSPVGAVTAVVARTTTTLHHSVDALVTRDS
ncbi:hypothetical protein JOF44_002717 [Brachybacterium fresconis]|uniref:Uncharacterized protein n=1 Tax=Brachybacterium fresconis TaxID=173363 RepID=A0ABS4YM41_9MICO|nr:hypothetical protein [Brachybacterium fresconis]